MEAVWEDKYYNALQLKYANAITCHKSQGGQWKCVFIDNPFWQEELTVDDLKWLYTAITRAKELLIIVGREEVVAALTENAKVGRRYSGLKLRLQGKADT